jgi:hypothetical protein
LCSALRRGRHAAGYQTRVRDLGRLNEEIVGPGFGRSTRSAFGADDIRATHVRHGFKDALRAAGVNEDVNDALTGHSGGNPVARGYGSDDMVRRFGFSALNATVEKAQYLGLDLSQLRWTPPTKSE